MSRPRPQLRRNKSSRVDSNRHFYLITRRTAKHKKDFSVILCIQDQSVTKHSTKLNQQNESYCLTREKLLLISGDMKSNPGPVAHGTRTHAVLRNPSIALLQARFAQKGLKTLECTSDGSCFFSFVAHQLYNDPSYHMNVHAAGVEYVTLTYMCCHMSKVIQSFRDKITHGPEYICTCCDLLWFRPSVSKGAFLLSELGGQTHQFAKKMQQFEGTLA